MKHLTFIAFVLLICCSCKRFEPKPESEKFYCKINGDKFCPSTSTSSATLGSNSLQINWNEQNGTMSIRAKNNPIELFFILIFPDKNVKIGKIYLKKDNTSSKVYLIPNSDSSSPKDLIAEEGILEITKKDGFLISGTFEFNVKDPITNFVYTVNKGQFNKLSYYL
jgi:Family of unknown function (DUF6252)